MTNFVAQRVRRVFVEHVGASPAAVFPLLCPVREREWVDGWAAEVLFSTSGVAEDHCVFTTELPGHGRATWVVSTYDAHARRIGFTIFRPERVERLDVAVFDEGARGSRLEWTRTYTALDEHGNATLAEATGSALDQRMAALHESLRGFLVRPVDT
jgi:hypothetical protein